MLFLDNVTGHHECPAHISRGPQGIPKPSDGSPLSLCLRGFPAILSHRLEVPRY